MPDSWLIPDRAATAAERILDAAGRCFEDQGVAGTSIGDIARRAGCSRPTIYRYFDDRQALRVAFVQREARRIGARVAAEVSTTTDPRTLVARTITAALRLVRADPTLLAWFTGDSAGEAARIAASSAVIQSMVGTMFVAEADHDRTLTARWIVRVILSLLTTPGADEAEEQELIERFVVPVVAERVPTRP